MRVAVVYVSGRDRGRLLNITRSLARGIESQGHHVDIIDGERDVNAKLTMYNYLAIGTSAVSAWGGKIPDQVSTFLANAGIVAGKRSFAYIAKSGLRVTKTLTRLMRGMEKEGMYLKNSEILASPGEAEEIGKRLHLV